MEIDALDILSELGINYVEMYSDQRISDDINAKTNPGMSDELMEKVKARLQSRGGKGRVLRRGSPPSGSGMA